MDPAASSAAAIAAALISDSFKRRSAGSEHAYAPPGAAAAAGPSAAAAPASPRRMRQPLDMPLDMRPLNGLRALGSIFVVAFHSWLMWRSMAPADAAAQLTRHSVLVSAASIGGPLAVDFFLLLTGMLAAYQLLPALESSPSSWWVLRRYWRRRALRVLPAYLATNLVLLLGLPAADPARPEAALARSIFLSNCPGGVWRNLAFISNQDFGQACGLHLWSLSLQVQFYAAFPLLLLALRPHLPGFRTRLGWVLAAAAGAGAAWRAALAWATPATVLHLPMGDVRQPAELAAYFSLLSATYFSTSTRLCQLAMGASLGLLLRSHAAVSWLARRRRGVACSSAALQAAYFYLRCCWNPNGLPSEALWSPAATQTYAALFYYGSPFLSLLVAVTLVALMLHADPLHSRIASALGSSALLPCANLSFCLYLIHEPARLWALHLLPGCVSAAVAASPLWGLAVLFVLTLAAAYCFALLLHRLVELRF